MPPAVFMRKAQLRESIRAGDEKKCHNGVSGENGTEKRRL